RQGDDWQGTCGAGSGRESIGRPSRSRSQDRHSGEGQTGADRTVLSEHLSGPHQGGGHRLGRRGAKILFLCAFASLCVKAAYAHSPLRRKDAKSREVLTEPWARRNERLRGTHFKAYRGTAQTSRYRTEERAAAR